MNTEPALSDTTGENLPLVQVGSRELADPSFYRLADVPPELEWFANLANAHTRRAYRNDVGGFMAFFGMKDHAQFRTVTRAHLLAWRGDLEGRGHSGATIRRKLAALASLFDHLCESNAVTHNPVRGVKRPKAETAEGKTPALADGQARRLLEAPPADTLKGKRDRAILAVLLYHGLRREELCKLKVRDLQARQGVTHLRVHGKGGKLRFVPAHPAALARIDDYLEAAGHGGEAPGALFRPVRNPRGGGRLDVALSPGKVDACVVRFYCRQLGLGENGAGFGPHALRATAATHALEHQADITKVQEWLGHANISTTRGYDRRRTRPEESPTFRMAY